MPFVHDIQNDILDRFCKHFFLQHKVRRNLITCRHYSYNIIKYCSFSYVTKMHIYAVDFIHIFYSYSYHHALLIFGTTLNFNIFCWMNRELSFIKLIFFCLFVEWVIASVLLALIYHMNNKFKFIKFKRYSDKAKLTSSCVSVILFIQQIIIEKANLLWNRCKILFGSQLKFVWEAKFTMQTKRLLILEFSNFKCCMTIRR